MISDALLVRGKGSFATSTCLTKQQRRLLITQIRPVRSRSQCVAQAAGGGGLFGKLFGGQQSNADANAAAVQQQQAQPQQQQQVEFPPFQTLSKGPVYDLRFYEPYPVVEMDYRRRENGYLTLGQYQDGANVDRVAFNFTQPVVMTYHPDGRKVMQMMIGSRRGSSSSGGSSGAGAGTETAATLPAPTDGSVRLSVAGGEVVAGLRFSGYITPQTADAARKQLMAALEQDGLQLAEAERSGLFRVAQYGQVYTLEERLNEMLLRVQL